MAGGLIRIPSPRQRRHARPIQHGAQGCFILIARAPVRAHIECTILHRLGALDMARRMIAGLVVSAEAALASASGFADDMGHEPGGAG
jgi:hypothetical protein